MIWYSRCSCSHTRVTLRSACVNQYKYIVSIVQGDIVLTLNVTRLISVRPYAATELSQKPSLCRKEKHKDFTLI